MFLHANAWHLDGKKLYHEIEGIAFDASAQTTSGFSLNKILLQGPSLYPKLVDVLLEFRSHKIRDMFREISLQPRERNFHWFLIRPMLVNGRIGE